MPVKEHQLEPDMEQWPGSKLGKEYVKAVCITLLTELLCRVHHAEYIMQSARLDESQAGIKIAWRNINNLEWYHSNGRQ